MKSLKSTFIIIAAFIAVFTGGAISGHAAPGDITTIAGGGAGDGGQATSASLDPPNDVAVDSIGNIYIADQLNHRIRKVGTDDVITTIAGNGLSGYSGDGGPATSVSLNSPVGVAVDSIGNIYIADRDNHRIRKVGTDGIITTIAGNGVPGYSGDGGPAASASLWLPVDVAVDSNGNIYIVDLNNNRIRKVGIDGIITTFAGNGTTFPFSGDGGPAASASLSNPAGVAVDSIGNIYIADMNNNRIRKVGTDGVITTIAGTGSFGFSGDGGPAASASLWVPADVAVDSIGNIYITDVFNHRIRKVGTDGVITTIAGNGLSGYSGDGGPATSASLNSPEGVAVDSIGNIYIADATNLRIRKVGTDGVITTVAGNGTRKYSGDGLPATSASLWVPNDVVVDSSGNIYIADTGNRRIRKVGIDGVITTVAGDGLQGYSGDGGPAISASLNSPDGVAVDSIGNIYIADERNHRIRKVGTDGVITTIAGNGTGGYSGDGGQAISASLDSPDGVAVDSTGNIYIADEGNHRIRKVGTNGVIITVAGNGLSGYSGDGGPATSASLNSPEGVAVDSIGNIYIADEDNNRIRKVGTDGVITTIAGNGTGGYSGDGGPATSAGLAFPNGVAVDSTGNIYIADTNNLRIRKVGTDGVITTIAGNGFLGFSGDGGPAISASLWVPNGVAVDSRGNIYIADLGNDRIRKVEVSASFTVTPSAGTGGSMNPSTPQTVISGGTTTFTVTPDTGYSISSVTGCNGTLSGSAYTTGAITADCTVLANFITSAQAIQNLSAAISNMGLPFGVANSLSAPLGQASALLNDNNPNNDIAVCGKMDAFINQVNAKAQNGNLTPDQASQLLEEVNAIKVSLGCQ